SCLGETADVAVLEHRYRHARESTFRRVIAEILDDEIAHSRLGWRLLQQLEPRIDTRLRERLGAFLVPAFARLLDRHGARAGRAGDRAPKKSSDRAWVRLLRAARHAATLVRHRAAPL